MVNVVDLTNAKIPALAATWYAGRWRWRWRKRWARRAFKATTRLSKWGDESDVPRRLMPWTYFRCSLYLQPTLLFIILLKASVDIHLSAQSFQDMASVQSEWVFLVGQNLYSQGIKDSHWGVWLSRLSTATPDTTAFFQARIVGYIMLEEVFWYLWKRWKASRSFFKVSTSITGDRFTSALKRQQISLLTWRNAVAMPW